VWIHGVVDFTPRNHVYRRISTAKSKTGHLGSYDIVFDAQCLQCTTRERGIGAYSLNFISSLCRLNPDYSFAAILTTVASDSDIKKATDLLKGLGCDNLDILLLDPFLGSSKISFIKAMENLGKQLERLECRAIIVLSPFEKHKSVVNFPFSFKYKHIGILYDLIPLTHSRDLLISRNQKTSFMWSLQNLSKYDLLLPISKETAKTWNRETASKSKLKVIYGGGYVEPQEISKSFNNRFGILCVSAELPHKNLSRLIESYCLLPANVQLEHALTITGIRSSGARKKFAKLGKRAFGKIVFTDYLDLVEIKEKYRESRLLVMPSLIEGLSLPILEAWSNGLVAVGSKGTVAEELFRNNALLFDPFDTVAISNCIERFLTSEKHWNKALDVSMSSAEYFTWEATATLALNEIERLFNDK
jgi:glycosyltransferase involved in cell wall biosynthesis